MILARKTFEKFGYWPKELSVGCSKPVLFRCRDCKAIRKTRFYRTIEHSFLCELCNRKNQKFTKIESYAGKKFGNITVLNRRIVKNQQGYWKVLCKCGIKKFIATANLKHQKFCSHRCALKRYKNTGFKEISGTYWKSVCRNARTRGLKLNITISYLWDLYILQNRKCALTGLEIEMKSNKSKFERLYQTASLDRIDSSKGYVRGNVQWVHKELQKMKWDLPEKKFVTLCNLVAYKKNLSKAA